MTPERWQKIEQLYHAALEREASQRAAYLHKVCPGDDALRREVESLLAQEMRPEGFLETPALELAAKVLVEHQSRSLVGQQLGSHKIISLLGAGGMGEVYQAHDAKLRRDVAVKVLPSVFQHDSERLVRFQREARMLASLNHPNIATIYGLEQSDGVHYLVMELVPGETLAGRVSAGPLGIEESLKICGQIAEALEAAHEKGVIHRDLKPANVKVTPEGRVKVLDFGLAKAFAGDGGLDLSQAATLTGMVSEEGRILGTPAYMSPEQARGKPVDKRTDIWAFGCVLYELVTGQPAFRGETVSDTLARVLERDPDWQSLPPATPEQVRDLLLRCLQKDRTLRLRDVGDARIEIEEALVAPHRRRMPRRQLVVLAGVALVTLVAVPLGLNLGGLRDRLFGTAAPVRIRSIAVLPLTNLSGDHEQDYFADGMTDTLISDLAKIGELRVISRTSVMRYKDANKPLPEIAKELNVDAVVEGSVLRASGQVRITAQLIGAVPERHLWAKSYDRELRDVLALHSEVAQAIAQEIRISLTPLEKVHLARARAVQPDAYEAYLKGSYYYNSGDDEKSIESYHQAINLDPDYAPAYAGLAQNYYIPGLFGILPPNEAFVKMREAALKALEKDDALADAYGSLALVKLHYDWDWEGAEKDFRHALELNPNQADIHHNYAHYLMAMDRPEESVAESKRAVELDPFSAPLIACLGWHDLFAHQYDQASSQALEGLQMNPKNLWAHRVLGWAYEQQSMFDQAIAEFRRTASITKGRPIDAGSLGHALALSGRKQEAREVIAKLTEQAKLSYVPPYDIAIVYAGLGDKDRAFDWLQKAYQDRSAFLVHVRWDPRLANLRSDPRFADLLRRMNLQ